MHLNIMNGHTDHLHCPTLQLRSACLLHCWPPQVQLSILHFLAHACSQCSSTCHPGPPNQHPRPKCWCQLPPTTFAAPRCSCTTQQPPCVRQHAVPPPQAAGRPSSAEPAAPHKLLHCELSMSVTPCTCGQPRVTVMPWTAHSPSCPRPHSASSPPGAQPPGERSPPSGHPASPAAQGGPRVTRQQWRPPPAAAAAVQWRHL